MSSGSENELIDSISRREMEREKGGVTEISTRERKLHTMDPELYEAATEKDHLLRGKKKTEKIDRSRLQELIEKRPDLDLLVQISPSQQNTVLHYAASFCSVPLLKLIRGRCPQLIDMKNLKRDTALHIAARDGKVESLEFLIEWAKQNYDSSRNNTVVAGTAVGDGYVFLRYRNEEGNTPLLEALRGNQRDSALLLLEKDPQSAGVVNERGGESPLYLAAGLYGMSSVIKRIMEIASSQEAEMDYERGGESHRIFSVFGGPYGQTPLHSAVANPDKSSSIEYINLLMVRKELANKGDDDGRTALHYAALFNFCDPADDLLRQDISSVYQKDKEGLYPIHLAAIEDNIDIIKLLLRVCPDSRELLNRQGQNALHVAAMRGNEKSVAYMLKSPHLERLVNEKDYEGNTPLHLATIHLQYKIVTILTKDERVDKNAMNEKWLTASDITSEMNAVTEKRLTGSGIVREDMDKSNLATKRLTQKALKKAGATFGRNHLITQTHRNIPVKDPGMEDYKERSNIIVLVATLIATVTFAAGFTLPGGTATNNLKQPVFFALVICNTMAMYLSIIIVLSRILTLFDVTLSVTLTIKMSLVFLGIALIAMAVAFMAGTYVVIVKLRWLSILVLVMAILFLYFIMVLLTLLVRPDWINCVFPLPLILRFILGHFIPRRFIEPCSAVSVIVVIVVIVVFVIIMFFSFFVRYQ